MPQSFDDIIKSQLQMRHSQRGTGMQDARDVAARQINMRERGLNSTATPISAGGQRVGNQPAVPSDLQAAIAAQVGEGGPPLPTARPANGGQDVAMGGMVNPNQGIAMGGMVNPNQGVQSAGGMVNPNQVVADDASYGGAEADIRRRGVPAEAPADPGMGIAQWMMGLGGAAAAALLFRSALRGDPKAQAEVQRVSAATGLAPETIQEGVDRLAANENTAGAGPRAIPPETFAPEAVAEQPAGPRVPRPIPGLDGVPLPEIGGRFTTKTPGLDGYVDDNGIMRTPDGVVETKNPFAAEGSELNELAMQPRFRAEDASEARSGPEYGENRGKAKSASQLPNNRTSKVKLKGKGK